MGVVGSGAGYALYNAAVRELGPTRTPCAVYGAPPPLVMALSWLALAEPVTPAALASAALVCAGLCLALAGRG